MLHFSSELTVTKTILRHLSPLLNHLTFQNKMAAHQLPGVVIDWS